MTEVKAKDPIFFHLLLVSTAVVLMFSPYYFWLGSITGSLACLLFSMAAAPTIFYIWAKTTYQNQAKLLYCLAGNGLVVLNSLLQGVESGQYIYFLNTLMIPFLIFDNKNRRYHIYGTIIAIGSWVLTVVLDATVFVNFQRLQSLPANIAVQLNFFLCILISIIVINIFLRNLRKKDHEAASAIQRFDLAVDGTSVGIWDWEDPSIDASYWSPKFYSLLGYREDELTPSVSTFQEKLLHPDDKQRSIDAGAALLQNDQAFDIEYRLRHKKGHYLWFRATATVTRDHSGQVTRMVGSIQDIHDKKMLELQTRRLTSVFEMSSDHIVQIDPNGSVIYANKALLSFSASQSEELYLSRWHNKDQIQLLLTKILPKIIRDGSWSGELGLQTVDGVDTPCSFLGICHYDEAEKAQYITGIFRDISELKEKEKLAASNAKTLKTVLELIPNQVFWKDKDLVYQGCSQTFAKVVGLKSPDEIAGKTDFDFARDSKHAEDYRQWDQKIMDTGQSVIDLEEAFDHADGQQGFVLTSKVPIYNERQEVEGILGICTDITDRKRAQTQLEDVNFKLKLLLEASKDGFWKWDIVTHEVEWDDGFFKLLGYRPQEFPVSYEHFTQMLHPDDVEPTKVAIEKHLNHQEPFDVEYRWLVKSGKYRWFRGKGQSFQDENGIPVRMAGSITDIHKQKQLEQNLKRSEELLRSEKQHALQLSDFKTQFLARMSHDIRTPLNSVIGMIDVLQETSLNTEQTSCLKTISNSSNNLLNLINHILDMTKIEAGELTLSLSDIDLELLLLEAIDIVSVQANRHNTRVFLSEFPPMIHFIQSDELRLKQIILNLLSNAVKFTEAGTITLSVRIKGESDIVIQVSDTGIGIPEDKKESIFESYKQAESSTTTNYGGTGLGLSICKHLTELMGGSIGVESSIAVGSTFTVRIPLTLGSEMVQRSKSLHALDTSTILIVTATKAEQDYYCSMVRHFGGKSVSAVGAQEAKDRLEKSRFDACIVVGDDSIKHNLDPILKSKVEEKTILLRTGSNSSPTTAHIAKLKKATHLVTSVSRDKLVKVLKGILAGTAHSESGKKKKHKRPVINLEGISILIVDDVDANRDILEAFLRGTGCLITMAQDGKEAVAAFSDGTFDLVFMDMFMPVMGGIEAVIEMRRWESENSRKPTPILALTANAFDQDANEMLMAGCNEFLTKPIRKQQLIEKICHHTNTRMRSEKVAPGPIERTNIKISTLNEVRSCFKKDDFIELIQTAIEQIESLPQKIEETLTQGDIIRSGELAHELCGLCRNLGAVDLAGHCKTYQNTTKSFETNHATNDDTNLTEVLVHIHSHAESVIEFFKNEITESAA